MVLKNRLILLAVNEDNFRLDGGSPDLQAVPFCAGCELKQPL